MRIRIGQRRSLSTKHATGRRAILANPVTNSLAGSVVTDVENDLPNPKLEKLPVEIAQIQEASRVVYYTEPRSATADRFRVLRMRLRELQRAGKMKTILITSPLQHDGKSTIVLNLATVLAERGRKSVLVVESDLHRPTLTQRLGLNSGSGLAECLVEHSDPMLAIRRIEPLGWYLLPAGVVLGNPSELLQTETLPKLMQGFRSMFDWVLIDSPPVAPFADTLSLAKVADGVLLVAKAGQTPRIAVEEAFDALGREHVVGIVLNGVSGLDGYYSDCGYY